MAPQIAIEGSRAVRERSTLSGKAQTAREPSMLSGKAAHWYPEPPGMTRGLLGPCALCPVRCAVSAALLSAYALSGALRPGRP